MCIKAILSQNYKPEMFSWPESYKIFIYSCHYSCASYSISTQTYEAWHLQNSWGWLSSESWAAFTVCLSRDYIPKDTTLFLHGCWKVFCMKESLKGGLKAHGQNHGCRSSLVGPCACSLWCLWPWGSSCLSRLVSFQCSSLQWQHCPHATTRSHNQDSYWRFQCNCSRVQ